jgi:hypothetical protein
MILQEMGKVKGIFGELVVKNVRKDKAGNRPRHLSPYCRAAALARCSSNNWLATTGKNATCHKT